MNKFKLIKNENINIDKKILPLFSIPVILKILTLQKRNKYNIINPELNFTDKLISFKEIIEIFLKGLNLYNYHLNEFLKTHNKIDLILELKKDENYKFNCRLSNYFYMIDKFMPVFKIRSLLFNIRLFYPKRLFKADPYIRFSYRLRYIAKIYLEELIYNNNKKDRDDYRIELNKCLEKGKEFINEINNKINEKKNLIQNLKKKNNKNINKIKLNDSINSLLSNTNNNNNLIKNSSLDIQMSRINVSDKDSFKLRTKNDQIINSFEKIKNNKNLFNSVIINKTNKIKMAQTINSILKIKNLSFDYKTDPISVNSNPVTLSYSNYINNNSIYNNNNNNNNNNNIVKKPIINQYLKSMSIYNMKNIGIILSYSNIISFKFNSQKNKLIKNIYNLLAASFKSMYCLISKPVFILNPDVIIIQLFYYLFIPNVLKFKKIDKYSNSKNRKRKLNRGYTRNKRIKKQYRKFRKIKINVRIKLRKLSNVVITKIFTKKFKVLCDILSHLFKKPVELNLIRLHYPYNDSNILVNLLGIMINKIKLRIIFRKLFEKAVIKNVNKFNANNYMNIIPAFLSGINIRVAGRLLKQKIIPRKTVKTIKRGSTAPGKINFSDKARFTNKNKRGSFSITVSSGQNFKN